MGDDERAMMARWEVPIYTSDEPKFDVSKMGIMTKPPKSGIYHLTDSDLNDIRRIVREELQAALGIVIKENE